MQFGVTLPGRIGLPSQRQLLVHTLQFEPRQINMVSRQQLGSIAGNDCKLVSQQVFHHRQLTGASDQGTGGQFQLVTEHAIAQEHQIFVSQ